MRAARRRLPRTGAILAVSGLAATGLAGCQLFEIHEPEYVPSAVETCVAAHPWVLDLESARTNVAQRLSEHGAGGDIVVDGSQRLEWRIGGAMQFETDLTISVTNPGPPALLLEQRVQGRSGGDSVFSGDVAVPRNWSDDELTVSETMTVDDAVPDPIPWRLGRTWIDDTVGLVTTCTGDTLEVVARGTKLSWIFHEEGWTPPAPAEDETPEPDPEG